MTELNEMKRAVMTILTAMKASAPEGEGGWPALVSAAASIIAESLQDEEPGATAILVNSFLAERETGWRLQEVRQ
jgi:hypothetical protein